MLGNEEERAELNAFLKTFDNVGDLIQWSRDYDKDRDPDVIRRIGELKEVSLFQCIFCHPSNNMVYICSLLI